jgi:hypothetical protein
MNNKDDKKKKKSRKLRVELIEPRRPFGFLPDYTDKMMRGSKAFLKEIKK